MSWLVSATNIPRDDVRERLLEAKVEQEQFQPEGKWADRAEAQIAAGLEALDALLVAVEGDTVNVNISGHAKGTHEGDNDTVNVNVSGVLIPPDVPPPSAEEEALI